MELTKQEVEDYIVSEEKEGKLHTYYELEGYFAKGERKVIRYKFLVILEELKKEGKLSESVIEKMFTSGEYPIEATFINDKK